jgi:hypothetical protein
VTPIRLCGAQQIAQRSPQCCVHQRFAPPFAHSRRRAIALRPLFSRYCGEGINVGARKMSVIDSFARRLVRFRVIALGRPARNARQDRKKLSWARFA